MSWEQEEQLKILTCSIDQNTEQLKDLNTYCESIKSCVENSADDLKRSAQTFLDNQNPSAILGTKKFTSGFIVGSLVAGLIGIVACIGISYHFYNKALQLKYDDYKAKVFSEQAQIEKDYKTKIAELDKQITEANEIAKDYQKDIDVIKKFNELKKVDQSKLAHILSLPISYDFFNAINGDTKFFDFVTKNITYIKNDKYFYIKADEYDYDGMFNDKNGLSYYGFKPKE